MARRPRMQKNHALRVFTVTTQLKDMTQMLNHMVRLRELLMVQGTCGIENDAESTSKL